MLIAIEGDAGKTLAQKNSEEFSQLTSQNGKN